MLRCTMTIFGTLDFGWGNIYQKTACDGHKIILYIYPVYLTGILIKINPLVDFMKNIATFAK